VVSGLMVLARSAKAASELSRQIREDEFDKEYLAVVHGRPVDARGTYRDLLLRNKPERKTYVVQEPGKGVQEAILDYELLQTTEELSRVRIHLQTGRTHQIRAQFSSRGLPLVGERKYATLEDDCEIALWSCMVGFVHPATGEAMEFFLEPPAIYPWTEV
jgi:23S rRNA pseudouridine1911/1915/1917 synthase